MTFDDLKLLIKEGLSVPYARIFLVLNVGSEHLSVTSSETSIAFFKGLHVFFPSEKFVIFIPDFKVTGIVELLDILYALDNAFVKLKYGKPTIGHLGKMQTVPKVGFIDKFNIFTELSTVLYLIGHKVIVGTH